MSESNVRTAQCSCGQVSLRLKGDPTLVSSCSCQACQRRTGAPYAVNAFFADDQLLESAGETHTWVRVAESGNEFENHFCPQCGSTVWWKGAVRPGMLMVAAGAFADKHFPGPQRMVWTDYRAEWVQPPTGAKEYPRAP